jgi:RNA polymerase sigma-70 factor (ECF subfamily)
MIEPVVAYTQDERERKLIAKVAGGDRGAFRELFDSHVDHVYAVAARLIGNPQDAEDLTQDIFVTLWNKAKTLRGESKLSTWLHRVAVNKAINFKKRGGMLAKLRHAVSLEGDDQSPAAQLEAPAAARPDRQQEMKAARVQLAELMRELPKRQRTVYLLHKLEGLSYREIAEQLSISLSAVESLMHRAKNRLQQVMLEKYRRERKN